MGIPCIFGFHNWGGCKCTRCGKSRDEEHKWNGCKCTTCGKTNHDWSENCEKCARCGKLRFEKSADTIIDGKSGLIWAKAISEESMPWEKAFSYAKRLNKERYAGYNDWRVPSLADFKSLTEEDFRSAGYSNMNHWLTQLGFTSLQAPWYWSATSNPRNPKYAWYLDVTCFPSDLDKNFCTIVRCVRGENAMQ